MERLIDREGTGIEERGGIELIELNPGAAERLGAEMTREMDAYLDGLNSGE